MIQSGKGAECAESNQIKPSDLSLPVTIPPSVSLRELSQSPKSAAGFSQDVFARRTPPVQHQNIAASPGSFANSSPRRISEDLLPLGSPDSIAADRVFPIRSAIRVDPSQTPSVFFERDGEARDGYFPSGTIPGFAGDDIVTPALPRSHHSQSFSEGDGRSVLLPGLKNARPVENSRARASRHLSDSTGPSDSIKYGGGRRMQIFNDAGSDKSATESNGPSSVPKTNSVNGSIRSDLNSVPPLVTARFKHMVTAEGHAVITGRDGETLQRCEDEPIHIPGAVQGFGLLIAMEESEEGQLLVRIVSENSHRFIGYHPQELFKLKTFTDILTEEQCENLLDHIDFIRDEETDPATNGPEVFTISIKSSRLQRKTQKLWCAMHVNPAHPDLIICEFELDDDQTYPLSPPNEDTPEPPEDTLNSNPTLEEFAESTHNTSKPLRVLRSARRRKGEAAAMEVFNIMSQVQEQLASAPNLDSFLKILVGVVKELTGFHRVMIYQFDASFNGRVVTELVDPRATKDLYKGLNFPASDIPKQARDLYKINKVRMLYDRDLETARLVCRTIEDLETPLDLSFSYLRAMSPIHIKYLANMAVRSSMSISINAFNEMWGLIACHSYGTKGMRVSFPIRKMCRLIGDTASRNIERLSYASRLQARKLINTVPTAANPSGYIIASSDDLLKLFDADFGLVSIRGETKIMGSLDNSQESLAMLEYLRLRKLTSVVTSHDISSDFPDLCYSPGFTHIAGLLLVPLSVSGSDFIVFFRKGQVKEVKWAGNPYEKFVKEGTEGFLEPRKSFKTWSETVVGKCRDWSEEQVETAAVLCLVYGKFIEVWRQKEAAMQNSQLTRLLLANSAHEVRTPLNAIINYLEIALEGALDQDTRDNLAKSHSASKSLIYVINDLLDLTKTEEGKALVKDEVFDLPAAVREATDSFKGEAKRKGLDYQVIEHPGVPQLVHGDQRRVRQAITNVVANAMQHTTAGYVRVEVWQCESFQDKATVEIIVQDSGCGMSNNKLDALFRDLEQVTVDADPIKSDFAPDHTVREKQKRILGLGLAMVARIVRNMDGQLRLKSEEGKGSRFIVQLPFIVPMDDVPTEADTRSAKSARSAKSLDIPVPTSSFAGEGEVTLVERPSSLRSDGSLPKRSVEDMNSLRSFQSTSSNKSNTSKKSEVDRLIDAISGPFGVGEAESEEMQLHRSNSRGPEPPRLSGSTSARVSYSSERPGKLARSRSYGAPEHLRGPYEGIAGAEFVTDNKTLMKAIRMPDEFTSSETAALSPDSVQTSPRKIETGNVEFGLANQAPLDAENLQVLVAEDDPVNSRIIRKRLEKAGHEVYHTVNGEDCATVFGEKTAYFDVVLMDMQMPIVDGLTSTKMIRSFEKTHPGYQMSSRSALNGRVPIIAVSASLLERERETYIDAGFDGWILKPIDFKRLHVLLHGIVEDDTRDTCLYHPGGWEKGGWFSRRRHTSIVSTAGLSRTPNDPLSSKIESDAGSASCGSGSGGHSSGTSLTTDDSESGSMTPRPEGHQVHFVDERKGSL